MLQQNKPQMFSTAFYLVKGQTRGQAPGLRRALSPPDLLVLAALWGSLLSFGRLPIGLRRLPTAAQDTILPRKAA